MVSPSSITGFSSLSASAFRFLVESALDIVGVLDEEGRFRYVNGAVKHVLGYSPGDVVGRRLEEFLHPDDREGGMQRFREIASRKPGSERLATYRLRAKDGSYRHLEALTFSRLDEPGIRGICMVVRDISERVEAERERAAALERRRVAAKVGRVGLWEWDPATDEMSADESVREIVRNRPGQTWQGPAEFLTRFLPEDRRKLEQALRGVASGEPQADVVVRMPADDGGLLRWIYIHAQRMSADAGPRGRVLGLLMDITERKRAEEKAAKREELLEAAVWGAGLGVWTWDVAADRVDHDQASADLAGLPRGAGEYTTRDWEARVDPDDLPEVRRRDRAIVSGETDRFEAVYRVCRQTGAWNWVLDRGRVVERGPDGRAARITGITLDFDEAKRQEQALADQRLQLELALTASHLGLWDLDVDTRRMDVDQRYSSIVGLEPNAVRDDPGRFVQALHPEDRDRMQALSEACLAGRSESLHFEGRLLREDSRLVWVAVDGFVAARHAEGQAARLIGTVADVTERRRREQLVAVGERVAQIGSWEFTVGADRFRWSEGTYQIYELPADFVPVLGSTIRFLSEPGRKRMREAFRAAREAGRPFDLELEARSGSGRTIWIRIVGRAEMYEGRPVRVYGIVQDVTERRLLETALLEVSNREQQRFGAELHDGLGQELTGIALTLQGLAQQVGASQPSLAAPFGHLSELLSRAIGSARAMAHGLAPISTGRGGLEAALRLLADRSAEAYGIEVSLELRGGSMLRLDDAAGNHLYRIAQEAISNSVRHGEATRIEAILEVRPREVRLCIADNGRGMRAKPAEGGGLGLRSMAYRARSLDGTLTIAERVGGGTVVTVDCPRPASG